MAKDRAPLLGPPGRVRGPCAVPPAGAPLHMRLPGRGRLERVPMVAQPLCGDAGGAGAAARDPGREDSAAAPAPPSPYPGSRAP